MKVSTLQSSPKSIKRSTLIRQREWITFYIAWTLFAIGWIGSVIAGNGGIDNVLSGSVSYTGTIVALLIQGFVTFLQWCYPDRRLLVYCARIADSGLTAAGYGTILVPLLSSFLVARGALHDVSQAFYLSCAIVWIVMLIPAWYPEHRLVSKQ